MTTLVPISHIKIPENRQRREFDEARLKDLQQSILSKGLLHPVVLRNDMETLVAGERRLRAIASLEEDYLYNGVIVPPGHIPISLLGELSELELREAELEENVIRQDLTWQEHHRAIADLHELRLAIHGEFNPSTKEGWTNTKTAEEIHGRPVKKNEIHAVSQALLLKDYLDDPIVSAARTPAEALKAIKEDKKVQKRVQRAKEFSLLDTKHELIQGDCYALLPTYVEAFDVIITDPPYGIDINKITFWDNDKHDYDDSDAAFDRVLKELPSLLYSAAKPQAHAYIFCDIRRFSELLVEFELAGWSVWPMPIIWSKGNTGSFPNADFGPRRTYECILYANKGKKKVTAMYTDVIIQQNSSKNDHPAGKPVEVYLDLLKRSVYPGDLILDCFCGGGPVFPAAQKLLCTAVGIEMNEKYHSIAFERLENL